jgi:hypothetical protein
VSQLRSGYAERSPLPEQHAQLLRALTLLIGVRLLDTIAGRGADAYERLLVDGLRARSIGGA